MLEKEKVMQVEIKINIEDNCKEYIDKLILGLVHSGYDVYFDWERKNICFTGWYDELINEIKK